MTILSVIWLILAALSALYGVLIFCAGSGSSFYLTWFFAAAFFVLCTFLAFGHRWSRLSLLFRGVFLVLVGCAAASVLICTALILRDFSDQGEPNLDVIIVLGCQVRPDGRPSRSLAGRLNTAAAYLKGNPDTAVIVSGGQGNNEPCTEAEAMASYLKSQGIDSSRILLENQSATTEENLKNSFRLCHPSGDRIGIVTSNYHLYRALRLAHKLGEREICGIAAPSRPLYLPNNMLREVMALLHSLL